MNINATLRRTQRDKTQTPKELHLKEANKVEDLDPELRIIELVKLIHGILSRPKELG